MYGYENSRSYNYHVDEDLPSYMQAYSVPSGYYTKGNRIYGEGLVNLSKQTQYNLDKLKQKLVQIDPCYAFGLEHWHPDRGKVGEGLF